MQALQYLALGALAASLSHGQLSIPPREFGFVYKNGQGNAQVKLAAYIDLTCPDSQAAFPTLVKVADQFKPAQVQLKVYLFSLPYHRNSHTLSKAAFVLNAYKSPRNSTVYDWIAGVYNHIDTLTTAATVDKTDVDVLDVVAGLAFTMHGMPPMIFKAAIADPNVDQAARLEWKYGCTRGVYGTPLFTVNDVFFAADPTWTVAQWTDLINQLLSNKIKM